ncbi:MAG: hypothetical protein ABI693_19040 [Bryobacteraceae bacterium]
MLAFALLTTLQFHYDVSEFVNAVYHVSCLTGRIACSSSVYGRFWNESMQSTREDGADFDKWSEIFSRAENAAGGAASAPLLPNYLSFFPALRVRQSLIDAALRGGSPDGFRTLAEPIVGVADAAAVAEVTRHVTARLHPWFVENAPSTERRLKELEARVRGNGSAEIMGRVAKFVKAKFPGNDVWVHLLPSPAPKQTEATGTALRNHSFIELTESMTPEVAAPIVVHELTHSLCDSASQSDHLKLISQFTASQHPAAQALYGLLNEALATSVQLRLYEQGSVDDKDVYRHPYIPRAGRATLPLLKEAMERRTTIQKGFVKRYVAAVEKEIGSEIDAPRFQLLVACVMTSDSNKPAREAFFQAFRVLGACSTEKELEQYPGTPAVRLLRYDEQEATTTVPEFEKLRSHRAFVYRQPNKRSSYVLAGRDTNAIIQAVEELAKKVDAPAQGLLLAIE